jgi:hypothetical protein
MSQCRFYQDDQSVSVPKSCSCLSQKLQGCLVVLIIGPLMQGPGPLILPSRQQLSVFPPKLGDSPAKLIINQGFMAALQERYQEYHSRTDLEPGASRFSTLHTNHYATRGINELNPVWHAKLCIKIRTESQHQLSKC